MTDPERKLRVLVLDEYFPYPPDSGKPIRTWNLLRRLASRHHVTLLCYGDRNQAIPQSDLKVEFVDQLVPYAGVALYSRLAANVLSPYPYSVSKHFTARFRDRLTALLRRNSYDLLQCEWTPYARYLRHARSIPSLVATHNVESQIWFRRSENASTSFSRLFFHQQAEKMERFERGALKDASWVTAVSQEDAQTMRAWGIERLSVVDNGVDLDLYQTANLAEDDREILFLASLDWEPNIDGLNYFLSDILKEIAAHRPDVRLTIAGRRPSAELRQRTQDLANVNFVGEVSDVRPLLEKAAVVVVPLRIGGGSRLKILEAMAAGKAIVSTTVGAEGLSVRNNVHLQIADAPAEFSAAVLSLLSSPETRRRLGAAGRKLVEQKYAWDECANKLESAWFKAVEVSPPASLSNGKKP